MRVKEQTMSSFMLYNVMNHYRRKKSKIVFKDILNNEVFFVKMNIDNVEPEDLVKFGLIPEFVGRLPVISTLHELDEDAPGDAGCVVEGRLAEMEGPVQRHRDAVV